MPPSPTPVRGGQIAPLNGEHETSIELEENVNLTISPSSLALPQNNKEDNYISEEAAPLLAASRSSSSTKEVEDNAYSRRTSLLSLGIEAEELTDWSEEDEKRLVWKIDRLLMPLLILAFFALQLDRGNIGNALTDYFFEDIGITQSQFNVGQQLLSSGIVALEIPSNMILYRIGPSLWLSCQIVAWGTVATLQAFQHGVSTFWITRLLLGLCESGFIPAALFTITRWYKTDETSKRYSIFFIGNTSAQAISSIAAYGILQMRGIFGLAGWQWLFIIEGLFTVIVGLIFVTLFPRSPNDPTSLTGKIFFSERERQILVQRVLLDDPSKAHGRDNIPWSEVKATLLNWRLLPHTIFTIVCLAPGSTLSSYGPTLISQMGHERLRSNAIWSLGQWLLLIMTVVNGFVADKIGLRGPVVLVGGLIWWVLAIVCRSLIYSDDNGKRLVFLLLAYGSTHPWHPTNGSWMAMNARTAGERSITMAVLIMAGNTSGIVGGQLFQESDGPYYPIGWSLFVGLVTLGVICMVIANVQYPLLNRWARRNGIENKRKIYSY